MPIYGYVCEQCGQETEVFQGINDPPLKSCPVCMGPVRKQFYPAGVIFKGSGFYKTDYASKSSGQQSKSSEGGSSGGTSSDGAGDSKGTTGSSKSSDSSGSSTKSSE